MTIEIESPQDLADKFENIIACFELPDGISYAVQTVGDYTPDGQPTRIIPLMSENDGRDDFFATFDNVAELDQYLAESRDSGVECPSGFDTYQMLRESNPLKMPPMIGALSMMMQANRSFKAMVQATLMASDTMDLLKKFDLQTEDLLILTDPWLSLPRMRDKDLMLRLASMIAGRKLDMENEIDKNTVVSFTALCKMNGKKLGPCCKSCARKRQEGLI